MLDTVPREYWGCYRNLEMKKLKINREDHSIYALGLSEGCGWGWKEVYHLHYRQRRHKQVHHWWDDWRDHHQRWTGLWERKPVWTAGFHERSVQEWPSVHSHSSCHCPGKLLFPLKWASLIEGFLNEAGTYTCQQSEKLTHKLFPAMILIGSQWLHTSVWARYIWCQRSHWDCHTRVWGNHCESYRQWPWGECLINNYVLQLLGFQSVIPLESSSTQGINKQVRYTIVSVSPTSGQDLFYIWPETGIITVKRVLASSGDTEARYTVSHKCNQWDIFLWIMS